MLEPRRGRGDLRRCVQEKKQTDRLWATRSMCKDASWRLLAISVAQNALFGTEMAMTATLREPYQIGRTACGSFKIPYLRHRMVVM